MTNNKNLKNFGIIWSIIFIVIGFYPLIYQNNIRLWCLVLALLFIAISLLKPNLLQGFYKTWIKIGDFIGGIISKVIMVTLFFGLFTPISVSLKILGIDLLNKKINKKKSSYWLIRKSQPQSMKNQF